MKIQFEFKDEEMFFNMISSQKIFGELAEKSIVLLNSLQKTVHSL